MIVRYAFLALLFASITGRSSGQEALTYPDAIPPLGMYTFDVRNGSLPLANFSTNPPYNLGSVTFDAPHSSTRGFMLKTGYPFADSFNSATHCRFTIADVPDATEYEYAFIGSGAVIALGTATSGTGAAPYADAYTAWVFPSYFATDYQDAFENGVSCVGTYTPVSVGDLQTNFGNFTDVVLVQRQFNCGGNSSTLYQWYAQNDVINILAEYNTATQQITLNIPTGFSAVDVEEQHATTVRLFPNPTAGSTVRATGLTANVRVQVELVAADGRTVQRQQLITTGDGSIVLEATNLPNGAYTMRLTTGGDALRMPLVINR